MEGLSKLEKPFKYVVNCFIMQKNGAGVNYANSLYCDNVTDGISSVKWPVEKQVRNKCLRPGLLSVSSLLDPEPPKI